MSEYRSLQPSSRTELEKNIGESQIYPVDHPVSKLWNADTCPSHLLPWLAWALSVDYWDEAWPDSQKRAMVKAAWRAHKYKGTCGAIDDVLAPFGLKTSFIEWWQTVPQGLPGTFNLDLFNDDRMLNAEEIKEVQRLINAVKPLSRHIGALRMGVVTCAHTHMSAAAVQGVVLTVYPFFVADISTASAVQAAAAIQTAEVLTVYPG